MGPMLLARKAALIIGANPWAMAPNLRANAHTLFTAQDAMGRSQATMQAARAGFLAANRAALIDFFTDMMTAIRWFHNPANHKEVVGIVARLTKQDPASLDAYLFTADDTYSDPNLMPDLDALQKSMGIMQALGFIKESFEVKNYADLSLVTAAAQRLQ
jgi:sulfonate transport system substrate-binding protein